MDNNGLCEVYNKEDTYIFEEYFNNFFFNSNNFVNEGEWNKGGEKIFDFNKFSNVM